MRINTVIHHNYDWVAKVYTSEAQYKNKGNYWTYYAIVYKNGTNIKLISKYSKNEIEAIDFHKELCNRVNNLFTITDKD